MFYVVFLFVLLVASAVGSDEFEDDSLEWWARNGDVPTNSSEESHNATGKELYNRTNISSHNMTGKEIRNTVLPETSGRVNM